MRRYRVRRSPPLRGVVRVPADKSIGHRWLIAAALADGPSQLDRFRLGGDQQSTAGCLQALGVAIDVQESTVLVQGVGMDGLRSPAGDLDCGNSGTTMRLLAGLLAGQPFDSRLVGDASLHRRPMRRVIDPLRQRGADIEGSAGAAASEAYPPLQLRRVARPLASLDLSLAIASAQVKGALLLSGLVAQGPTRLREPALSRDHTERLLAAMGVPLQRQGLQLTLDVQGWSRRWQALRGEVPGDLSSAAFLHAAALMVPGSELSVLGVGVNPSRTGLLDVLRGMGDAADVHAAGASLGGEPVADLKLAWRQLQGTEVGGELLLRSIDEVPALCAVAALARGTTVVRDAAELRVKESDRIAALVGLLRAFGVPCSEQPDGLCVQGVERLVGAQVASGGDHRIAMAAALLGLAAEGETLVEDTACVGISFPDFVPTLQALGASIEEEEVRAA